MLSKMLKKLRAERRLTQSDLAKALGLTRSAIGMYESGSRRPDYETLELFADFYNVNMDALLGREPISSELILSPTEKLLIEKYRQLERDGRERIMRQIDFELYQLERFARE